MQFSKYVVKEWDDHLNRLKQLTQSSVRQSAYSVAPRRINKDWEWSQLWRNKGHRVISELYSNVLPISKMFHKAWSVSWACLTVVVSHCRDLKKKISVKEGSEATQPTHISDLESGFCLCACEDITIGSWHGRTSTWIWHWTVLSPVCFPGSISDFLWGQALKSFSLKVEKQHQFEKDRWHFMETQVEAELIT